MSHAVTCIESERVSPGWIEVNGAWKQVLEVSEEDGPRVSEERQLLLMVNVHPVALRDPGVRAVVREPEPRAFAYAWTILPGIGRTTAQVYATTLDGERTLVDTRSVQGGEILRGEHVTTDPGPLTFELFLGGVPYGDLLLVP